MAGRPVIISDQTHGEILKRSMQDEFIHDNNAVFAATISRLAAFEQKEV